LAAPDSSRNCGGTLSIKDSSGPALRLRSWLLLRSRRGIRLSGLGRGILRSRLPLRSLRLGPQLWRFCFWN